MSGNFVDVFVNQGNGTSGNFLAQSAGHYDRFPLQQEITPTKQK